MRAEVQRKWVEEPRKDKRRKEAQLRVIPETGLLPTRVYVHISRNTWEG